jgi:hypothetical protein
LFFSVVLVKVTAQRTAKLSFGLYTAKENELIRDAKRKKEQAIREKKAAEAQKEEILKQRKKREHKMMGETEKLRLDLASAMDNLAAHRVERDALRKANAQLGADKKDLEVKLALRDKRVSRTRILEQFI